MPEVKYENMFAIIAAQGSQYQVEEGQELLLPKLQSKPKAKIIFDQVLLLSKGKGKIKVGKPHVKNAKVKAEVLEHLKGKKIRVATYKSKSRYRRVKGHRDHLTRVKILSIVLSENV